jgi:hypothetical protein
MTTAKAEFISIDELRRRLKGNGLIAENEGVFHADHILIKAGENGTLTVCAVAKQEAPMGTRRLPVSEACWQASRTSGSTRSSTPCVPADRPSLR